MTKAQTEDLLKKVLLLEAKAVILNEEAAGIRSIPEEVLDPENKKAKVAFERAKKMAERAAVKAEREAWSKRNWDMGTWRKPPWLKNAERAKKASPGSKKPRSKPKPD